MAKIQFPALGKSATVDVGTSVWDAAQGVGIDIEHACGGNCACATCHVYVNQGAEFLSPMDEFENDRLNDADERRPTSRLSCQAKIMNPAAVVSVEVPE